MMTQMKNRLISATLLDSFQWMMTCPKSWKESATKEFIEKLKRKDFVPSDAIARGLAFEDLLYKNRDCTFDKFVDVLDKKYSLLLSTYDLQTIYDRVQGKLQVYLNDNSVVNSKSTIVVADKTYKLTGIMDVWYPETNTIVDIKTTASWKGEDKYKNRNQHNIYMYATGAETFIYTVVCFVDNIVNNLQEIVICKSREDAEKEVRTNINAMMNWITENSLLDLYLDTYCYGAK